MNNSYNDRMSFKDQFAFAGRIAKHFSAMGIDYDGILEGFTQLEQQIGQIPSLSPVKRIPEAHKEKMYEYYMSRVQGLLTDTLKIPLRKQIGKQQIRREKELERKVETELKELTSGDEILTQVVKLIPNIIGELVKSTTEDFFQMTDEELLNYYVRNWEMLFNFFIGPIWDNLKKNDLLPRKRNGLLGREAKIIQVRDYLERDKAFEKLSFLFLHMNTKLRNGIVHLHYYVDQTNKDIVYFYRDGNNYEEKRIEMNKLEDICSFYSALNLMILIIIGNRIELSDEIQRELNKQ